MHGVILDAASLGDDMDLAEITQIPGTTWEVHTKTPPDLINTRIQHADLVLTNKIRLSRESINTAKQLKLVSVMATGTDIIDLQACSERGIVVCNAVAYATDSVVQHTMALLLALATGLQRYTQDVRAGKWQQSSTFCLLDHPIMALSGKTLGIIGYGELGSHVGRAAQAFGMNLLVAQRPGARPGAAIAHGDDNGVVRLPLQQLLPAVDVLSLHCPLTRATQQLINAQTLAAMKPTALLINTARGGLVDSAALLTALQQGVIAGAAVDVLPVEPPDAAEPLIQQALPNLIVTPHTAWAARESRQRLITQMRENIDSFLQGVPLRQVVSRPTT